MKKLDFFGKIINGGFRFRNGEEEKWLQVFSGNLKEGDDVKFSIEKTSVENYEVLSQRRYYRGVPVRILGFEFGYSADEMHQVLAKNFLSYEKESKQKRKRVFIRSTAHGKITTKEFSEFLEKVWELGKSMNVKIPTPKEIEKNPKILEELYPQIFKKKGKEMSVDEMRSALKF